MPKYTGPNPVSGPYNVPAGANIIAGGKYGRVVTVSSAPFACTGSNGGVIGVSNTNIAATYTLMDGGTATNLAVNIIHEISPETVTSVGGGTVYLYYSN